MPTNKNAQLRYQILDRCLSDFSRSYTFENLLDEVNDAFDDLYGKKKKKQVSVRTLREDLRIMGDSMFYNAPIKATPYDGRKCYYHYSKRNYSIFKQELTIEEVDKLGSVIDILGRYRGNPNYTWVEEILNSLECRFGLKPNTEHLVSFEHNEKLKSLEYLSTIIDATIDHQPLAIHYHSFKGPERDYQFHPYFVKQYNNRWFLFGKINGRNYITDLALDRMEKVTPCNIPFIQNNAIDFKTYFDDIVGVTKFSDKEPEQIVLKFSPERFPYVVNKPIHKSQVILDEKEHKILLLLRWNSELESRILFYGPDVEVIKPLWLKEIIISKLKKCLNNYHI